MNIDNTKAQMRKGVLEMCILALLAKEEMYTSDIIDKLKGTPKWKHADAAVRLEGLKEIDDPAVFAEVLETDTEARVRRFVVSRVDDVAVLTAAAKNDGRWNGRMCGSTREVNASRLSVV